MKKIAVLLMLIVTNISINWGQEVKRTIPNPTNAQALFKENNAKITKDLETKTGLPMSKLKLVKSLPEWHRFFGPKNEEYGYPWPEELISNYWEYHTPKDANGVYKTISVAIVYTRLNCDKYPCLLTNNYALDYIAVSDAYEDGFKKLSETEILNIAINHFKSGNAKEFSNLVKIEKIESYNPQDLTAKSKLLKYSLYGELGIFNYDKSTILSTKKGAFSFNLYISLENNDWKIDSLQLADYLPSYKDVSGSYKVGVQKEHYQSYETVGFDAIYKDYNKTEKPLGIDDKLIERSKAFYQLVKSKGANLTKEDLNPFLHSSIDYDQYPAENTADANFIKLKSSSSLNLLKDMTFESGSIIMQEIALNNSETKAIPTGNVYFNTTIETFKIKKGNPVGAPLNELNLEKGTSWVYINNQWFLLNNGAFFMEN